MIDFGYYIRESRQFMKEQRRAESLSPQEYGMMIQKKRRKKKRGGRK